jgi:hypothetical protein
MPDTPKDKRDLAGLDRLKTLANVGPSATRVELKPEPDITAAEVAQLLCFFVGKLAQQVPVYDQDLRGMPPEVARHFKEQP